MNESVIRVRFIASREYNSSDAFISEDSYSLLEKQEIHSIPILIGHMSNEGAVLFDPVIQEIFKFNFSFYENNFNLLVPRSLNIGNDTTTENAVVKEIKNKYFSNSSLSRNAAFANYYSDDEFIRGIRKAVDFLRKDNDIYFYIFDYKENSNTEYTGVPHIGECKYLFYSQEHNGANKKVINKMTTLWTNFAKTGNPTPVEDPTLDNIKWPIVPKDPEEKMRYVLIRKKLSIKKDSWQKNYKFWNRIYKTYGRKPYILY